jgi:hypothetical protein
MVAPPEVPKPLEHGTARATATELVREEQLDFTEPDTSMLASGIAMLAFWLQVDPSREKIYTAVLPGDDTAN